MTWTMTWTWGSWGRRTRRIALACAAVLAVGALSAAAVPAALAATGTPPCGAAQLSAQLKAGSPGAGQRYATVVLTNPGSSACTVHGYGGLALLGAPREGVPTDLRRVAAPAPATVTLAPGGSARSLLHWTVVPAGDESGAACEPTAVTVVVTPPNQTTSALQAWTFGPVCQHGLISQNAYVAGSAAF